MWSGGSFGLVLPFPDDKWFQMCSKVNYWLFAYILTSNVYLDHMSISVRLSFYYWVVSSSYILLQVFYQGQDFNDSFVFCSLESHLYAFNTHMMCVCMCVSVYMLMWCVCMHTCVWVCAAWMQVKMLDNEQIAEVVSSSTSSTMWILGRELRSSDLITSTFTHWATSCVSSSFVLNFLIKSNLRMQSVSCLRILW